MSPDLFSSFYTHSITVPGTGSVHVIRTDAGIGSLWTPTTEEKAAIAAGGVVMVWLPGVETHPTMFVQALLDPTDDANLGIPDEANLTRVTIVGGPHDGSVTPASFGRCLIYRTGPANEESSHEAYGHIPGDPPNEFRHLATYLADTIPGANQAEKLDNLADEFAEADAFRQANYTALAQGVLPPQASDLTIPITRLQAYLILIKYPAVPQPGPLVPGP